MKGMLQLHYPIECGVVTNWDDLEIIWQYCFENKFKIDPMGCNLMVTEPPKNPKTKREQMLMLFFETFQVERYYVSLPDPLACVSNGRTTGLVC